MAKCVREQQLSDVDNGWAWIVLLASFFSFAILWGQVYSFNIYYVVFLEVFGESRSYTAWIGSLNLAVIQIAAISAGCFISRLGARGTIWLGSIIACIGYIASSLSYTVTHLLFAYGIIVAFGFSICIYGLLEAISKYFKKYLYLATGISMAGGGVGLMCFSYIIDWLIDLYGWRGSLLIQGALCLQIFGFAATVFIMKAEEVLPLIENISANHSEARDSLHLMSWKKRVLDTRVALLVIGGFLQGVGVLTLYVIYKDFAISKGLESIFSTTSMVLGVGNLVGRALSGLIMSRCSPTLYYSFITAMCAGILFLNILNDMPIIFILFGAIFGYGHGSISTAMPLIIAFLFGRQEIATTYGYLMFFAGIGTLIGPPLAGYLTDNTGSYIASLTLSGSFLIGSSAVSIILHYYHHRICLLHKCKQQTSIPLDVHVSSNNVKFGSGIQIISK